MKSISLALLLSCATFAAHAGGTRVGDGGHGVVCEGWPPVLLDVYEATHAQGRTGPWIIGDEGKTELDYIFELKLQIESYVGQDHPSLKIFDDAQLLSVMKRLEPGPLADTWDQGATGVRDPNCHIEQIAVRGLDIMSGSLVIRQDYWVNASARDRAILLIHEAAHEWFGFDENSIFMGDSALRQFVGLVYTSGFYLKEGDVIREILTTRQPVMPGRLSEAALR